MFDLVPTEYFGAGDGFVKVCPPGTAQNAFDLNQRGHCEWPEITCWPDTEHYRLTTGAEFKSLGVPVPLKLTNEQKQMCSILGLSEDELGIFLRGWEKVPSDKFIGPGGAKFGPPETIEEIAHHLHIAAKMRR